MWRRGSSVIVGRNRTSRRLVLDWKAPAANVWIDRYGVWRERDQAIEWAGEPDLPRIPLILSPRSLKSGRSRNEISFAFDLNQDHHPRALSRPLGAIAQGTPIPIRFRRSSNVGRKAGGGATNLSEDEGGHHNRSSEMRQGPKERRDSKPAGSRHPEDKRRETGTKRPISSREMPRTQFGVRAKAHREGGGSIEFASR
jgi:hypothetical protein